MTPPKAKAGATASAAAMSPMNRLARLGERRRMGFLLSSRHPQNSRRHRRPPSSIAPCAPRRQRRNEDRCPLFLFFNDLPDGDEGEEPGEKGVEEEKPAEGAHSDGPLDPSGTVSPEVEGHEGHLQGGYYNDEPFEPHGDVHQDRGGNDARNRAGPGQRHQQSGGDEATEHEEPEERRSIPDEQELQEVLLIAPQLVPNGQVLAQREVGIDERQAEHPIAQVT